MEETKANVENANYNNVEIQRLRMAYHLGLYGLALSVILVFVLVLFAGMRSSTDIVSIVGLFTSVTGTLVGAFFGLHIGSAGKEQDRQDRRDAEEMTRLAMMAVDFSKPEAAPLKKKLGMTDPTNGPPPIP